MRGCRSVIGALGVSAVLTGCARPAAHASAAAEPAGPPGGGARTAWVRHAPPCEPSAAGPGDSADTVAYDESAAMERPVRAVLSVEPAYPEELRDRGVGGEVRLRFVVGRGGCAEAATIQAVGAAEAALVAAVRDAVLRSRFAPAERGGRPVRQWVTVPYAFAVRR